MRFFRTCLCFFIVSAALAAGCLSACGNGRAVMPAEGEIRSVFEFTYEGKPAQLAYLVPQEIGDSKHSGQYDILIFDDDGQLSRRIPTDYSGSALYQPVMRFFSGDTMWLTTPSGYTPSDLVVGFNLKTGASSVYYAADVLTCDGAVLALSNAFGFDASNPQVYPVSTVPVLFQLWTADGTLRSSIVRVPREEAGFFTTYLYGSLDETMEYDAAADRLTLYRPGRRYVVEFVTGSIAVEKLYQDKDLKEPDYWNFRDETPLVRTSPDGRYTLYACFVSSGIRRDYAETEWLLDDSATGRRIPLDINASIFEALYSFSFDAGRVTLAFGDAAAVLSCETGEALLTFSPPDVESGYRISRFDSVLYSPQTGLYYAVVNAVDSENHIGVCVYGENGGAPLRIHVSSFYSSGTDGVFSPTEAALDGGIITMTGSRTTGYEPATFSFDILTETF